ncbi:hypothetical protein SS50377_27999 [Spironucleus salmonicida]|uniref:Ankyrin repeat-containing protein n=1 Tax=Spironucleus salmonicida TaxID=348837 RepID=V6LDJ7_9EUKA|nr:hypothetical protein SS50377_27999 [Spironucleus salmonicida]|eukprot:EST42557.1 Hypothetical protein SS50377_17872 [Spironucleus salmonicida]
MKDFEYFLAIKNDNISVVLRNYPSFKDTRSANPPGLSSLLYAAHENATDCIRFLKDIEAHLRTEKDIVLTVTAISQDTRYTLGKGSTALMIAILRNADSAIKELIHLQIGNRNSYGMTSISFAGLCCSSQPSFEILQNEDYLLEELPLQELGDSALISILCYFGQLKGLNFLKNKIETKMFSEPVQQLIFRQLTLNVSKTENLVNLALTPMKYEKFNTTQETKVHCANITFSLTQIALDHIIQTQNKNLFADVVAHWRKLKVISTQFGNLEFRTENDIILEQFKNQNLATQALLKDEEDIIRYNKLDMIKDQKEAKIDQLKYRRRLRIQLELALFSANKCGVQFRKLRNIWFQCNDLDHINIYKKQFRRVLCDEKNEKNGLVLAQIAVIYNNLDVLKLILDEEFCINLPMNISIKTEFGDCVVPKGSNLLQIAVIVNSEKCAEYLLQNALKYRFLGHLTSTGETTFEVSLRSKGTSGNAVLDDEYYIQNEMLLDTGGDSIMMKSVKYNNVHMLLKWENLVLRIEFAVKIFEMCLKRDTNGYSLIDLCQSEEANFVIQELSKHSIQFVVDNYLYNDGYWRELLEKYLGEQFEPFLIIQMKNQRLYELNLDKFLRNSKSLLVQRDYYNYDKDQTVELILTNDEFDLDEFQENRINIIMNLNKNLIFSILEGSPLLKSETNDQKQYIQDVQMEQEIQNIYDEKLVNCYEFLMRQDNRQTNYANHIYNGFYPVHYAIYQQNNLNLKNILNQQLFCRTKATHYLQALGLGEDQGLVLHSHSSTLQLLLISGKIEEFCYIIKNIIHILLKIPFHQYQSEELLYLDLIIDTNQGGISLLDLMALLEYTDSFASCIKAILQLFVYKDKKYSIYFNNTFKFIVQSNNIKLLGQLQNVFSSDISEINLIHICIVFINQLNLILSDQKYQDIITQECQRKLIQLYKQCVTYMIRINKLEMIKDQIINDILDQCLSDISILRTGKYYNNPQNISFCKINNIPDKKDLSFLNETIQPIQKSSFYSSIQQNSFKQILNCQKKYINQVELRDTNYVNIFNGFNALAYAIMNNSYEMMIQLFDDYKYQKLATQVIIYSGSEYYVFSGSFNILIVSIITQSEKIFNYIVGKMKSDSKLQQILLSEQNEQILTRLAAQRQFIPVFKVNMILTHELQQEQQFIQNFPQTKCCIFDILESQSNEVLQLLISFLVNKTENMKLIESFYIAISRRVNFLTPIDYIKSFKTQIVQLLFNIAEQSIYWLIQQDSEFCQQILKGYYFDDEDLINDKLALYKNITSQQNNQLTNIKENYFIVDQPSIVFFDYDKFVLNNQLNISTRIRYSQTDILIQQLPKTPIIEKYDTYFTFKIYKGFTQLHYAIVFDKTDLAQYFLSFIGNVHTAYPTIYQNKEQFYYLPAGTSALHLSIIHQKMQLTKLILNFYILLWFNVELNANVILQQSNYIKFDQKIESQKEKVQYFFIKNNSMPQFDYPLTLCALQSELMLPINFIHAELQTMLENDRENDIANIIFACIYYKNLQYLMIIYNILKDINEIVFMKSFCYLKKQKFVIKYNIIQQIRAINKDDSSTFGITKNIQEFIFQKIAQLNTKLVSENKFTSFPNIQNLYGIQSDKIYQSLVNEYDIYKSPCVLHKQYPPNFIIINQIYKVNKHQAIFVDSTQNQLCFQVFFQQQSNYQSDWFDRVKQDDTYVIIHHLQKLLKSYDKRATITAQSIFYGWAGIHYAVFFESYQIIQYLAKFEADLLTQCDQLVIFKNQIYFVPKNSNAFQLAIIIRNNTVLDILISQSTKIQKQFLITTECNYLEMMQVTGMFNEEIAQQQNFDSINMEEFLSKAIKMNNQRLVQYIFDNYIQQDFFYIYVIKLIQSDVLPPEHCMNKTQLFILDIFPLIDRETYQKLDKFKEQLEEIYGIQKFNDYLEDYRVGANNIKSLTTNEKIKKINNYEPEENYNLVKNEWFDACKTGDMATVLRLKQFNSIDRRDSYYKINQYNGFSGIHYALLNKQKDIINFLLKYEFYQQIQSYNIVNVNNQAYLISKGTTVVQLGIITQQINDIIQDSSLKSQRLLNKYENLQYYIIADLFPQDFGKILAICNDNFISQIFENKSYNFVSQLIKFIEDEKLTQDIIKLIQYIFQSCSQMDYLFTIALECCNSNINIKSVQNAVSILRFDKFSNYMKGTRQMQNTCLKIYNFESIVKNKFKINNFDCNINVVEDVFFDSIPKNDVDKSMNLYSKNMLKIDSRSTSNLTINGFNCLFYAVYYANDKLTHYFSQESQNYRTLHDIILPNGIFLSMHTSITTLCILMKYQYGFNLLSKLPYLDSRGYNFVCFSYIFQFKEDIAIKYIQSLSLRKIFKLIQLSRSKELAVYVTENFSPKQICGLFIDDLGNDFVGKWFRTGWIWQDQKVRIESRQGVRQLLISKD